MPIRTVRETDASGLARLLDELGYPAPVERVVQRLPDLLSRPDHVVLVSEEGGVLIGLACAHVFPVIHRDEPVALITALVVSASARRRSQGRDLVRALEEFARSRGCGRILVTTANQRSDAHAFYERLGYTFTGRRYAKQPL